MMTKRSILALAALAGVLAAAACERGPTAPEFPGPGVAGPSAGVVGNRDRSERLARRFARAMRNPAFRAYIKAQLDASEFVEHKLHFQRFLRANGNRALREFATENGERDADVSADADSGGTLEFYFPVPAHRAAWTGDENLLVATIEQDGDIPVAYDTRGRRQLLSPDRPPATPVLALVPTETDFDAPGSRMMVCEDPDACGPPAPPPGGGSGGGSGGPITVPPKGLYMTAVQFTQGNDYESWLKGSPEIEVHVLGQDGQTDQMTTYQCAGEHAGGPYAFDQNHSYWNGNVLLFSKAQFDQYKAQHPGQAIRLLFIEDDDDACTIRLDGNRLARMLAELDNAYRSLTGGRDSTLIGQGLYVYRAAQAGQKLFAAAWSFFQTKDELIGTAVEDAVVGQTYPGYNWFIKADNSVTNGWVKLEMR